ncbi:MAG: carboxylating nicotinate-nucleotide diphosphorylase [Candidatus Thermoplasmatota archaeon]|nr:carboxylating nicotinate-nucleotide diphosphorylase [Candidatus Thermoplasmatota archaeon]
MDEIDTFLLEDLHDIGDITSDALFTDEQATAIIIAKQQCIVAGLKEAQEVFLRCGATCSPEVRDGEMIEQYTVVVRVSGSARSILKAERLALNFLGRMSGIASVTRELVDVCKTINPKVNVAATRKTTPGFRKYEKKAVQLGGGEPHRYGLYDAIMIKDNHIRIIGSISKALEQIEKNRPDTLIEIEVENEDDALLAITYDIDVIMFDNFTPDQIQRTSEKIRRIRPDVIIEASGGITPENISAYAPFADRISLGYITHSIVNKDFSLEME